MGQA
jgi:hypothetical protein